MDLTFEEETPQKDDEKGVLTELIKDLIRSDEVDKEDVDEEIVNVPQEGFHGQETEAQAEEETEEERPVPERIKLLKNTIIHTRHFISMVNRPQWQLLSLDIVANAIFLVKLEK